MPRARERILLSPLVGAPGSQGIVSAFQFVTTGEDNLRLRSWTLHVNAADPAGVELGVRTVGSTGQLQVATYTQTPPTSGLAAEKVIALDRGAIVNLSVRYTGTTYPTGATYATVELVRGQPPGRVTLIGQLLGDYVTIGKSLAWPGSPIVDWRVGPGHQRRVQLFGAGPGSEVSVILTGGLTWRPLSFTATLTTDATVATRFPGAKIFLTADPTNRELTLPLILTLGASAGAQLNWATGYGTQMVAVPPRYYAPMPLGLIMGPGYTFSTDTVGLQAGDLWNPAELWVEEFLMPTAP